MAHTTEETRRDILHYYFTNKNNSCVEIGELFGVKSAVVRNIIDRGFVKREVYDIYESKMNSDVCS